MLEYLTENETNIRLSVFLFLLFLFIGLEFLKPKRKTPLKKIRWINNFILVFLNSAILKATSVYIGIHASVYAIQHNFGLFNLINISQTLSIIISIIILDFAIYWQHRLFHIVPIFWRLHQVHHSDIEYDVSTALRFHPVEIILSYFIKYLITIIFGIPLLALIIFEIILNATAMFNHSNVNIPQKLDTILRKFIVTPDMHRVHHSVHKSETDSNYGFNIPLWDYIFGSYIAQPKEGHLKMLIGVNKFRNQSDQIVPKLLVQPIHNE